MRNAQGPFPIETIYTWQPAGDGSTGMTLRNRGEPVGFLGWRPPDGHGHQGANRKDLRKVRAIFQAR